MPPAALVLVVDDDVDLGQILVELIESRGMAARLAASVADALRALEERRPELVVLDWFLPDGPPTAVAARCRAAGVPIVLSSALDESELDAGAIGARATLPKPFDVDSFYRLLDQLLGAQAPAHS